MTAYKIQMYPKGKSSGSNSVWVSVEAKNMAEAKMLFEARYGADKILASSITRV